MRLKDKVSVITGSGKGIGKSIALLFAQEGSKVVVCSRTRNDLDQVQEEISRKGGVCLPVVVDVGDKRSVDNLVSSVLDKYGRIDILVNNAGIFFSRDIVHMSEQEWDSVIDTNLKGMFLCCKAIVPVMIAQKKGKIINTSSVTGTLVSSPNLTHYSASKAGAMGFTISLALELAQHGINVNAVSPGTVVTPGYESILRSRGYEGERLSHRMNEVANSIPLKRLGDPVDIAYAALFLASEESNYITGQMIVVDGGNVTVEHKS